MENFNASDKLPDLENPLLVQDSQQHLLSSHLWLTGLKFPISLPRQHGRKNSRTPLNWLSQPGLVQESHI